MAPPNLKEPPKWRMKQLEQAGAMNFGATTPPSLTNPLSPLFARSHWEVTDTEYTFLLPSLHLASHYLEVALPYLCTFLPSSRLHQSLQNQSPDSNPNPETIIQPRQNVTEHDLHIARAEIAEIAKTTRWQLDWAMRSNNGWLGITRTTPQERPWDAISAADIKAWDEKARLNGAKRRPLIVGIMKEYVMALQANPVNSEVYLRAAFMAAYTIFHEVGHVVFLQDFRAWHPENVEPWVGDAACAELGLSLGARVFNGYNPVPADLPNRWWYHFTTPLYWDKTNTTTTKPTPWKAVTSISIEYMQDCFTDSFWDAFGDVDMGWSRQVRMALNPFNKKYPEPAVAMQIQFGKWDNVGGEDDDDSELTISSPRNELNERVKLAWKKQPYDRTRYEKSVWSCLTPEDKNWVRGKGPRLIDPVTGFETTGEKSQQRREEDETRAQKIAQAERFSEFKFPIIEEKTRPKFESLIEPVMLDQDVQLPNDQMENPKYQRIVQIRVKHRQKTAVTAQQTSYTSSALGTNKRGRSLNNEGPFSKKRKTPRLLSSNGSAVQKARKTLDDWSIERMERDLTHQKASELCQKRNIEFGTYYDNAQWQMEKLNYEKKGDRYLMERIRVGAFLSAGKKVTGNSVDQLQALLELTVELGSSVTNWGPIAAKDFCNTYKIHPDGTSKDILARISSAFEAQIEELASKLEEIFSLNESASLDKGAEDYFRTLFALNQRTSNDYINNLIARQRLPAWGSPQCKRQRVENFCWINNTGKYPPRKTEDRTFDGIETYVFNCNVHSTTVESLLSSLYLEGCFPHNAHLALLRDNRYTGPLNEANKTLADALTWSGESVIDLQLQVTHPKVPISGLADNGLEIYQPRNALPLARRTFDRSLKRKANIIVGKAIPTVAERLQVVKELGEMVNKAFTADGGKDVLRPHKQVMKSRSGGMILENLKDKLDEEDAFLDAMGVGEVGDSEEIDYENGIGIDAVSGSHMANMYKSL